VKTLPIALVGLIAATAAGCGSSGDGNGGAGGTTGAASGSITWKEGGAAQAATIVAGARARTSTSDLVQITGGNSDGVGVSFGVSTLAPPLTTGPFTCEVTDSTAPFASFAYVGGDDSSGVPACSITLTTLGETTGMRTAGTFSATIPLDSGATLTVTDGVFDVVLTVTAF
jgi:hypothetical protein